MLRPDGTIVVNSHLPASTIMQQPEFLKYQVEHYFNSHPFQEIFDPAQNQTTSVSSKTTILKSMPTPEGLARAVGFANFNSMKRAIESPDHPEEAKHYLLIGCSLIAEILTKAGLHDKLNTTFSKFVMSAYLGINEKTEQHSVNDNHIHITWHNQTPEELPTEDVIEMQRLESSLPERMQLQYEPKQSMQQSMQRPTSVPSQNNTAALKELLA